MSQTQSTTKKLAVRTFATLAAMSVLLAPLAFAADPTQTMTGTVTAINTLSITGGAAMTLVPTVTDDAVDSSTVLAFDTNDGGAHRITVVANAPGWAFDPAVVGSAANTFPILRFVSATSDAGTAAIVAGVLIDAVNGVQAPVDVVTAITSVAGSATVTLDASITQTVVAGSYTTTLTYALVTP